MLQTLTLSANAELAGLRALQVERTRLLLDLRSNVREVGRRTPNRVALNRERRARIRTLNALLSRNEHAIMLTALAYCDALTQEEASHAALPHARPARQSVAAQAAEAQRGRVPSPARRGAR